ncbi:hypothetical protein EV138_2794 [Kribbella voronezhensis]|uniref:Uncharacterized protein n=1 Tax=Kribbella voronezhensis TaxID=2512212 RepID=A0A4V3FK85_9ACTN|nr:hypothetical protein EV138_2794 [Kribbella voronezhensis]
MGTGRVAGRIRPLVAVVAAVAVAAVAAGGLLASRRNPEAGAGAAVPLAASNKPQTSTPPKKLAVDAAKLQLGREPQVPYVRGRTLQGGGGQAVVIPGKNELVAVARLWDLTLTVQLKSVTSPSLVVLDGEGKQVNQVPGVDSLVTSADGQAAAYASGGRFAADAMAGGTVYFQEPGKKPTAQLSRPHVYDLEVLAVIGKSVYFHSARGTDVPWELYRWQVDKQTVTRVSTVASPVAVSTSGTAAAGFVVFNDSGMCTAVTDLASGRQSWRTCQYQLTRFSPTDRFVLAIPPGSSPYGDELTAALDSKTGALLREWDAGSLRGAVAEDDDHVLLQWHDRPEPQSRSALVRCTISTGQCELATPLSSDSLLLGS